MSTGTMRIASGRPGASGWGALALCLALLTTGCASGSSSFASADDLFDYYDNNNDDRLTQDEWGQNYKNLDTNGDGVVTREEFDAAVGGFRGGGGRR